MLIKRFSVDTDTMMLSGWQFLFGGAVMTAIGLIAGGSLCISGCPAPAVLMLIYLAFISACAYSIWSTLLKYNPVSKIAVFGFMNPVCGVLLSALLLGEAYQPRNFHSQQRTGTKKLTDLSLIVIIEQIYTICI